MFYGNTCVRTRCKGKLGTWGILEKKPKVFFRTVFWNVGPNLGTDTQPRYLTEKLIKNIVRQYFCPH